VSDVDDVFDLKKLQQEQRSQKVAEFGEIGVKTDCKHCVKVFGARDCDILRGLYCVKEVCHFYDKKEGLYE
jgi:hypothetical protein